MRYNAVFILFLFALLSCKEQHKHTNALIHETSPYLLQHAHNPVDWHAWNDETLAKAKRENKLLLISIGYASCHWCHVMEEESFENEEIAKIMNENFINVKVDREERPDVDQIYLTAVQMITGNGGWPLNCIALPDGKPIWGATYLSPDVWKKSITQVATLYKNDPNQAIRFAENVAKGIQQTSLIPKNTDELSFTEADLTSYIEKWKRLFDTELGGYNFSNEKFPIANNYQFMLRYAYQTENQEVLDFVNTTLSKMALGGIFDHLEGGFSRYSTDKEWQVPHFEKMLYDNGQLVSLYADAYLLTKNELYKETITKTLSFVEQEMLLPNGGFISSLDADSSNEHGELEEGAYYVWSKDDLQKHIGDDFKLFAEYYTILNNTTTLEENFVLHRTQSNADFIKKHSLTKEAFDSKVKNWNEILLKAKKDRSKPRKDKKVLTSWNALMLQGYVDAYRVLGNEQYLKIALKNANFIKEYLLTKEYKLYRNYASDKASINAYLEDYALLVKAYLSLYQSTFDDQWLQLAKNLTETAVADFYDSDTQLFYFTSKNDAELITKKVAIEDQEIASSNSVMASNLFMLSHYFDNNQYATMSQEMLHAVLPRIQQYPSGYANWLDLYMNFAFKYFEVAISGANAKETLKELNSYYLPNKLYCGSTEESDLPLLQNRFLEDETMIYVCVNKTCNLPTSQATAAKSQILKK